MSRIPKLRSGCDIKSLPLTPADGFLLSRLDAAADEQELAAVTGFAVERVVEMLDRLTALGAIEYARAGAGAAQPHVPAPAASQTRVRATQAPPAAQPPREDDVEIDPARRRRIVDLYSRLDQLTHYALLGVDEQASTRQVKAAYNVLAAEFHPDRYFRKRLGPYQLKIEAIFSRCTLAHDVLVSEQRAGYDERLARLRRGGRTTAQPQPVAHEARDPRATDPSPVRQDGGDARIPPGPDPEELRMRRRTLANKLSGTFARTTPHARVPTPPEADPETALHAVAALHAQHERAVAEARASQIAHRLEQGRSALAQGDFEAAVDAYRLASSLAPADRKLRETCEDGIRSAARALAEASWDQAVHEESGARWEEAALCYAKVCTGRPGDALAHERAANASLRAGHVRRAVELARRAIELDPASAMFRITLARTYVAAGLETSFHQELERALALAPNDARVQGLVSRLHSLAQPTGKAELSAITEAGERGMRRRRLRRARARYSSASSSG